MDRSGMLTSLRFHDTMIPLDACERARSPELPVREAIDPYMPNQVFRADSTLQSTQLDSFVGKLAQQAFNAITLMACKRGGKSCPCA